MLASTFARVLLLALAGRAFARACPENCVCGESDGVRVFQCEQDGTRYEVKGLPHSYAEIHCERAHLNWSAIPFFPFAYNSTLESFTLSNCELPSALASLLESLGANDARGLVLKGVSGQLEASHVEGLSAVEALMMVDAADQTRIPYDVFDALPALKDFRIRGARLQLEENGGDRSSPPPAVSAHPALRLVELASSGITDAPPGAFARLNYVNKLFLWGNKIRNFTSDTFRGLDHLDTLDLTGNPLGTLPPHAFAAAPRLRSLHVVATRLAIVPGDALRGHPGLETILFKFGMSKIKFGPGALAAMPALKQLIFDRTPLDQLPGDLLENSTALEELMIKGTGLEALPEGLFRTQQRIEKLDLSGNKIKELKQNVFWPLKALKELNLDENKILELPEQLFSGLIRLTSVTANNNGMKHIAADAFQGSTSLQYLSLNDNQLTLKPKTGSNTDYYNIEEQSPFKTLFNLKELLLQGNNITEIFSDWRWALVSHLKRLDLSRNNISDLTETDVQFLASNLTIDLRFNRIASISVLEAPPGMPADQLPSGDTGSVMLLDDNPFRCDCDLFMFVKRLHGSQPLATEPKLDVGKARCTSPPSLAGTLVRHISPSSLTCSLRPQDCPANCTCDIRPATLSLELNCDTAPPKYPNPENFYVSTTKLRLRSFNSLSLPTHVVSLNLSGIGLTESPSIDLLKNVEELDLSRNNLTRAPVELFKDKLDLHLAGNPFECDCSHVDDVIALQANVDRIYDSDNVTCRGGESPWHVDAARLCDVKRAALLGGCLAGLGLIAAVVAALSYRYILEIKVFLFSRGWCQRLIEEDELDKDAEYDAFVSFSQEDAKWVSEQLLPKLEGAPDNFKLCVHYRDWVVGDMIPAQIARSVEQSRRTIVVLTENFLKSTWASLEFRAANVRAQRERRARVLVIVLGDVPESKEMDAELKAYLTTNTYLKWGDPWFWEKLRFAMPHRGPRGTQRLKEVYVPDKLKRSGLDARLNSEGKIVNDATPPSY
ncbi:protein toll-like [Ostrinia nubilalis]|uniref:protein toll-like n=1 Tax=Ostrinia nubilalis TaxID=29057 RepID=UPI00308248B9